MFYVLINIVYIEKPYYWLLCGSIELESTNAVSMGAGQEQENFIESQHVENGVRLISLSHAGELWRIGSITPSWRNYITNIGKNPDNATLKDLRKQGIWLEKKQDKPRIATITGGQGSVFAHMGRELYDNIPAVRAAMERIAAVSDWDILALLDETDKKKLMRTRWQAPYIFFVSYAQAYYLETLGYKADIVVGHSLGELIALCLAGVYSPEDAWGIINKHSKIIDDMEQEGNHDSGMMAVHAPYDVIKQVLEDFPNFYVSSYNSPTQYILSGTRSDLEKACAKLKEQKIMVGLLNISMAFHHPGLRTIRKISIDSLMEFTIQAGHTPVLSNVTADLYPNDKESICEYIADLDESPVRWVDCVNRVYNDYSVRHFVELGPTATLSRLISEIQPTAHRISVGRKGKEVEAMRRAVAELYSLGHIKGPSTYVVPDNFVPKRKKIAKDQSDAKCLETKTENTANYVEDIIPLLVRVTGFESHQLSAHMDLRYDLAMRSSRFPVVINEIEKTFNVKVNFEDFIDVATIADLAKVVANARSLNIDSTSDEQPTIEKPITTHPIVRSVIEKCPFVMPGEEWNAQLLSDKKEFLPAVIVGKNDYAQQWYEFLTQTFGSEQVLRVEDILHAQATLEQDLKPGLIVIALPYLDEILSYKDSSPIIEYMSLVQAFLRSEKGQMCIVHEELTTSLLGSNLFASLNALLLTAAQEYPQRHFRAIHTKQGLSNGAMQGFMQKILCTHSEFPLYSCLNSSYMGSLRLKQKPWAAGRFGLPISKGQVIIVSGGGRGITPKALEGLAMLECTLLLLGRSAAPSQQVIEKLAGFGAKCVYYACDVSDKKQVQTTLASIFETWGEIHGLIHGAGINEDVPLSELSTRQISQVMAVKYDGLENLLQESVKYGLRYAVGISSLAAWCGNIGQANYAAANRAMAALLEQFCTKHDLFWRCLWLAPVNGNVGMLSNEGLQSVFTALGVGLLDYDVLPMLFARELLCGTENNVIWHKSFPQVPTLMPDASPTAVAKAGLAEDMHNFPHLYPKQMKLDSQTNFIARRNFSVYADGFLASQKTSAPEVSPLFMLDTLYSAARMGFTWLQCSGASDLHFESAFKCPDGITREGEAIIEAEQWTNAGQGLVLPCQSSLEIYAISENGRRLQEKQCYAKGKIYLSNEEESIIPLWGDNRQELLDKKNIHEHIFSIKNIAEQHDLYYNLQIASIGLIQKLALPTYENYQIVDILHFSHVSAMQNYDIAHIDWQLQGSGLEKLINAQIVEVNGKVLLVLQGLRMLSVVS